jgi:hypothetical protein
VSLSNRSRWSSNCSANIPHPDRGHPALVFLGAWSPSSRRCPRAHHHIFARQAILATFSFSASAGELSGILGFEGSPLVSGAGQRAAQIFRHAVYHLPGEYLEPETEWWSALKSNWRYRFVNRQPTTGIMHCARRIQHAEARRAPMSRSRCETAISRECPSSGSVPLPNEFNAGNERNSISFLAKWTWVQASRAATEVVRYAAAAAS